MPRQPAPNGNFMSIRCRTGPSRNSRACFSRCSRNEMKVVKPPTRSVSPRSKAGESYPEAPPRSPGPGGATPDIDQGAAVGLRGVSPGDDLQSLHARLNNEPGCAGGRIRWTSFIFVHPASGGEPPLKIVADETKNSLLIMANDRDYQRVLRVIQGLDVVASQVLIEAVIAEVTLNDKLQYGVQWQLSKGRNADRLVLQRADRRRGCRFPGFNYAVNAANIAATLSALEFAHACQRHFDAVADGARQQDGQAADRRSGADHDANRDQHRHGQHGDRQFDHHAGYRRDPFGDPAHQRERHGCSSRSSRKSAPW